MIYVLWNMPSLKDPIQLGCVVNDQGIARDVLKNSNQLKAKLLKAIGEAYLAVLSKCSAPVAVSSGGIGVV